MLSSYRKINDMHIYVDKRNFTKVVPNVIDLEFEE